MAINKSVQKAIRILELIARHPEGITISEIYKTLDMPKATVFDILQALYEEDAIYYKDLRQKTYVVGSKIFSIGQAYAKNSNFINFSSPLLKSFADKYSLSVHGCKRLVDKLVYIYKYEAINAKLQTSDVGFQEPLFVNIAGRTFLAFLEEDMQKELLNNFLENDFAGDINKYNELVNDIKKIKEQGYGIDDGITTSYIYSVAIPVFSFDGKLSGTILFSEINDKKDPNLLTSQLMEFKEIASIVSMKQGYKQ